MKALPWILGGLAVGGAALWFARKPIATLVTAAVPQAPKVSTTASVLNAAVTIAQSLLNSGKTPAEAAASASNSVLDTLKINL